MPTLDDIDAELKSRGINPDNISSQNSLSADDIDAELKRRGIDTSQISNKPMNIGQRFNTDVWAGLAQMGHGIINTPSNLANTLAKFGAISPETAAKIPRQQDYNYSAMLGVSQPNLLDKLVQGSAQYLPATLAGGSTIAGQAIAGGVFGATQNQNPLTGAAIGAAIPILGGKAIQGGLAAAEARPISAALSKYAAPGLGETISGTLEDTRKMTNQQAFDMAKNNYGNYAAKEKNAWDNLSNEASKADSNNANNFDNSDYVSALNDKLTKLSGQAERQSAFGRSNADAQTLLNGYMKDEHGNFTDAIEHNKSLNQDYQNEITPGKSLPFDIVNFAKSNLKKTINQNIEDNGLQETLGKSWQDANQSTADKNSIFNEVANVKGQPKYSSFSQFNKGVSTNQDPTSFVFDYLPKTKGDGTQGMEQFSKMLGNDDAAKNVIKMNYFDKSFRQNQVDPKTFMGQFDNLSQEQQEYLFNSEQLKPIRTLSAILAKNPNSLNAPSKSLWSHGLTALIGGTAGHFTGIGPVEGAVGALVASNAGKAAVAKLAAQPAMQKKLIDYLNSNPQPRISPETATTLMNVLSRAIPSAITPHLMGGNQ